jgi:hypothetical protein
MALDGIGGNAGGGGEALARFQRLRDAAQKKLDGADRQAGLAGLIASKRRELGAGAAVPGTAGPRAERIPPGRAAPAGGSPAGAVAAEAGAQPSAVYGRTGAPRNQDSAPKLGRYVDFLA